MPIYEYQCPKCGTFDVLQKMSDKPLKTHDVCGSKVQKLLSAGAFAFKGSGFYITDYKSSGKGEPSKSESKNESSCSKSKGKGCGTCPSGKAA